MFIVSSGVTMRFLGVNICKEIIQGPLQTLPEIAQAKTMFWEMFREQNAQQCS